MAISALVQSIVGFVAIVGIGVILRITGLVPREGARPLNAVIIYVGLPAFIFRAVHGARLSLDMLAVVGLSWAVFGILLAAAFLVSRFFAPGQRRRGGFVLATTLGNTGYIGYPLTSTLLGAAAVPIAVFYDVFGTVLQLVLVGFPVARRFGGGERLGIARLLRELVTFPALIAAVVAIATSSVPVPGPVSTWLDLIAKMVAPLIMLSVGISLRPKAIAHGAAPIAMLALIKLLFAPLVALAIGSVVLADPVAYRTAVLEASMPSMMLTLAAGERFGLDDDFIAAAIFVTTAASAVTIPLVQMLMR